MTPKTALPYALVGSSRIAVRIAIGLSGAFLAILFLLHFLEPEFDPSWRMISEYELGQYGWMMSLAFFCWGGSVLALRTILSRTLRTRGGRIGQWWLLVIGVALFGAGIFITDPITNPTTSTANSLHTLCGAFVILTFPMAATLVARSLTRSQDGKTARGTLFWTTLLVWIGLVAYFGSIIISNLSNPAAGRNGPEVLIGWPNRFMVVVYNLWIITVALHAGQSANQQGVKST